MASSTQKAAIAVFLSITTIFTIFILYTTNVYFIVFRSVRTFGVTTPQFHVNVVNTSYISTTTDITIQNPSELTFELRQMRQTLYLSGEFILTRTVSIPGWMELKPESATTLTIDAEIPPHKVLYVKTHQSETWLIYLRLFLDAPLVDGYSWANTWFITEQEAVQAILDGGQAGVRR